MFVACFISSNAGMENVVSSVAFCFLSEKACSKLPQLVSILMTTVAVEFCIRLRGLRANLFSVVHWVNGFIADFGFLNLGWHHSTGG